MPDTQLAEITAHIVSAYVSNHPVRVTDVPDLIASISASVSSLGQPQVTQEPAPMPAVNPKRSVFPDYIVCLEDGMKYKSLTRHLTTHGLTPEEYRQRWNLPADYPMVAPNYSAERSALAKKMGLGRKRTAKAGRPKTKSAV